MLQRRNPSALKRLALVLAAAFFGAPGAAEEVSEHDRFRLWNGCQQMGLSTFILHPGDRVFGASMEEASARVEETVRNGQWSAGWYAVGGSVKEEAPSFLDVLVVYPGVFDDNASDVHIKVSFFKKVQDTLSGLTQAAPVWSLTRTAGTSVPEKDLHAAITEMTDFFIGAFLYVNEESCGKG